MLFRSWKETKVTEITGKDGNPIEFRESKQRLIESIEAEIMDVAYEDVPNQAVN